MKRRKEVTTLFLGVAIILASIVGSLALPSYAPPIILCAWLAILVTLIAFKWWTVAFFWTTLSVIFVVALLPDVGSRPVPPRSICAINLKQIVLAIQAYEEDHGHLPPPYTTDEHGNRLHSWRVLILPYLDASNLYDAIDLSKPWDHPNNARLADSIPSVYQCPSYEARNGSPDVTTAYVVAVGDETYWPDNGDRKVSDVTDGLSSTLAVFESELFRLPWMSPNDPTVEKLQSLPDFNRARPVGSVHSGQLRFATLDGRFQYRDSNFTLPELLVLLTIRRNDLVERAAPD